MAHQRRRPAREVSTNRNAQSGAAHSRRRVACGPASSSIASRAIRDSAAAADLVLTDEELRRSLRQRGLARAKQFSWDESVRRVREIYEEVLAG
jgi:hypothetical protein